MLYLMPKVMIKLNILILATVFAFNLYAKDDSTTVVDQSAKFDVTQDGIDTPPITAKVDYKTQLDLLTPKLGDRTIEQIQHPWFASVKTVEGKVLIKRYNKVGDIIITFPAEEHSLLTTADVVDVGRDGRLEIEFKNKEFINLGPSTIVKIEQKGAYTLLQGSVRVRAAKSKEPKKIVVFAPNVNVASNSKGVVDVVVRYDDKSRTTNVACFDSKLNASGMRDSKDQKGFEKVLVRGDKLDIITTNEKDKEVYIAAEPERLSMDSKKQILESFYSDPKQVDSWEYTKLATSFYRFATSFEYAKFKEISNSAYINFTVGYIPLIYLGSMFYLEPYFHVSFANPFDLFFYRVGAVLQINPMNGLYFGTGGGAFWIHQDSSKYGADFTLHVGYTFADKVMSFIDGFRLAYFASQASGLHERAFMFSMVVNIGRGRELY